jgi:diguanylate cyclase (GGDEF)-like protein
MKRLRNNKPLLISILLFLVLFNSSYLYLESIYSDKKRFALKKSIANIENIYTSTINSYSKLSELIYTSIINQEYIMGTLKDANSKDNTIQDRARKRLYNLLKNDYQYYFANFQFRQLHFHLPNNDSFLRLHKPHKYGDNLSDIRYSVVKTNKTLSKSIGFEEGRIYNGFRYVYPIVLDDIHLGSLEVSISPKAIIKDIEEIIDTKIDFFINSKLVDSKVWDKRHYHISNINPNYLHEEHDKNINHDNRYYLYKKLNPIVADKMNSIEKFAIYRYNKIFTFIPIPNVEGIEGAGYLLGVTNSNVIEKMKNDNILLKVIALLASILISILVYNLINTYYRVNRLAHYDELTTLMNRRSFKKHLQNEIQDGSKLSLVFFDIDHFKDINDTFGHLDGDRVLKEISTLIKSNIRKDDLISRWGGEEFLILFKDTSLQDSIKISEKLKELVREYDFSLNQKVTCSFGVTSYIDDEGIDEFISRADNYLYRAKDLGRDRVESDLSSY